MIRRNPAFRPVEKFRSYEFVWYIDGRLYCGPRVLIVRDGLRRVRWAKKGYRHGNRIAARMKLWRVTGEPPF